MLKKNKGYRKLQVIQPLTAQGAGLFPSAEAHLLSKSMLSCFNRDHIERHKISGHSEPSDRVDHAASFLNVAHHYLFDKQFRDGNMQLEARKELKSAKAASEKLSKVLRQLSKNAESILSGSMRFGAFPKENLRVEALLTNLAVLEAACGPVVELKATRRGRPSLVNACNRLWTIREKITARPFVRSWGDAQGRQQSVAHSSVKDFVHPDAQFVLSIMTALDPTISLGQVRDALKSVAKSRRRVEGDVTVKVE